MTRAAHPLSSAVTRFQTSRFEAGLLAAALMVLVLWPRASLAEDFVLGVRVDFATGVGPCAVAVGDLNGDDRPDLVADPAEAMALTRELGVRALSFAGGHENGQPIHGASPRLLPVRPADAGRRKREGNN